VLSPELIERHVFSMLQTAIKVHIFVHFGIKVISFYKINRKNFKAHRTFMIPVLLFRFISLCVPFGQTYQLCGTFLLL